MSTFLLPAVYTYVALFQTNTLFSQYYYFTARLVNGPTKYEGTVEVYYNGDWGTVSHGWDLNDAQVVCKELGFGNAVAARYSESYGPGRGEIWLSDLQCVGTEWTIGNCSHSGWEERHYRNRNINAGVKCLSGKIFLEQ